MVAPQEEATPVQSEGAPVVESSESGKMCSLAEDVYFGSFFFLPLWLNIQLQPGKAPPAEAETPGAVLSEAVETVPEAIPEPVTESGPDVIAEAAQEAVVESEPAAEPAQDSIPAAAPEQPIVQAEKSGKNQWKWRLVSSRGLLSFPFLNFCHFYFWFCSIFWLD